MLSCSRGYFFVRTAHIFQGTYTYIRADTFSQLVSQISDRHITENETHERIKLIYLFFSFKILGIECCGIFKKNIFKMQNSFYVLFTPWTTFSRWSMVNGSGSTHNIDRSEWVRQSDNIMMMETEKKVYQPLNVFYRKLINFYSFHFVSFFRIHKKKR